MPARASISTILLRPLERALEGSREALVAFYTATDLTKEILADADARVSPAQFCVAWAEAVRHWGDSALALTLADQTPPGAFGVVEYVCRCAPTLGDALAQWVRYLGILDDAVEVALVVEGDLASLRVVTDSEAPAPASHELCFALVVRNGRLLLDGSFPVEAVRFSHAADATHAARHRAFFDAPVKFGAKTTELVVRKSLLASPLTTSDASLLAILLPSAEEKRARTTDHLPLTDQVRRALRSALTRDAAQLDEVAKRLGLTGRSLQRRLRDEGPSFQATREVMRRELADVYLGQGMTFAEISFMLGFSEPSAFHRAFKRWTGMTPFERRAAHATAGGG